MAIEGICQPYRGRSRYGVISRLWVLKEHAGRQSACPESCRAYAARPEATDKRSGTRPPQCAGPVDRVPGDYVVTKSSRSFLRDVNSRCGIRRVMTAPAAAIAQETHRAAVKPVVREAGPVPSV